jgi:2-polyprenyl-6-methoxyphenol hydroxylase-like FAD-dependent oxidoreductase
MKKTKTQVIISGGGSVGLSLAAELSYRNISCVVIEQLEEVDPHPRANAVASRTMEYYRRWGMDQALVEGGIAPDLPADYHFVSSMHGREIFKIALPSHNQLLDLLKNSDMPEPKLIYSPYLKTILGQNEVDAVLRDHIAEASHIDARFGTELTGFRQNRDGVTAVIRDNGSGEYEEIDGEYLVACDGGRSLVRTTVDIPLQGDAGLGRFVAIHFRAPGLNKQFGHGNIYFPLRKPYAGFLMNWDGGTTYTYHYILSEDQAPEDVDPEKLIQSLAGWDIPIDLKAVQPWTAHALVAEHYRCGRVFLAGDAAHLFTPTGGFGMNTGVSDAIDIAWKLQAMLEGWGGERLLDTYEEERRPIGIRNTGISGNYFNILKYIYRYDEELDEDSESGEFARQRIRNELDSQVVGLIDSAGCLLGYRYENSSICVPDGSSAPPDHPQLYWPTARPGHRAPHIWLTPETALLDQFGRDFTLIRFDPAIDIDPLVTAAERAGLPLTVLDQDNEDAAKVYERSLALVRPDLMVAWRGDELPADCEELVDHIRGA